MEKSVLITIKDNGKGVVSSKGCDSPFEIMGILDYAKRMQFIQMAKAAQSKSSPVQRPTSASTPVCPQCKSTDTGYRCCSCGTEFGADDD